MSKLNTKIKKVMLSEIGQATCMNCGSQWGQHVGIDCPHSRSLFEPEGFLLDDMCINCGDLLVNHQDRSICIKRDDTIFEKVNDMFSEEDFLL